jgi:ankyrin repeat protein
VLHLAAKNSNADIVKLLLDRGADVSIIDNVSAVLQLTDCISTLQLTMFLLCPIYSTLLHSTPLYSTLLHSTPLYSTLLYSTLLYSLIYCTALHPLFSLSRPVPFYPLIHTSFSYLLIVSPLLLPSIPHLLFISLSTSPPSLSIYLSAPLSISLSLPLSLPSLCLTPSPFRTAISPTT